MTVFQGVPCPICGKALSFRFARGRKSGKPFVMVICAVDGRHFRGYINDKTYVASVISTLEGIGNAGQAVST